MWSDHTWYMISNPDTLLNRYAFLYLQEEEWTDEENFLEDMRGAEKLRAHFDGKKNRLKEYCMQISFFEPGDGEIHGYSHSILDPIYEWWDEVVSTEAREVEIFLPLHDKPLSYDPTKYDDIANNKYEDPFEPMRSNPEAIVKEVLKPLGIEEETLLVYTDLLFMPFPILPEKFDRREGKENKRALPENLKDLYRSHKASDIIFEPLEVLEKKNNTIYWKERWGMPLNDLEKKIKEDKGEEYRDEMSRSKKVVSEIYQNQFERFFKSQKEAGKNPDFFFFGFTMDIDNYLPEELKNEFEIVTPFENRRPSSSTGRNIIKKGISYKTCLKDLRKKLKNNVSSLKKKREREILEEYNMLD